MKFIFLLLILPTFYLTAFSDTATKTRLIVKGYTSQNFVLGVKGAKQLVNTKEMNISGLLLDIDKPQFISFNRRNFYMTPGETLTVIFKPGNVDMDFEGTTAVENAFINQINYKNTMFRYRSENRQNLSLMDSLVQRYTQDAGLVKMSKEFSKLNILRFKYVVWASNLKPGHPDLSSLYQEVPELLETEEYRNFMIIETAIVAQLTFPVSSASDLNKLVAYSSGKFKNQALLEVLLNKYVISYISKNNTDDIEQSISALRKIAFNPEIRINLDKLVDKWSKIQKGAQSPDFSYQDIDGKFYSLKSFRGKYILLDFWATWCGPCKEEIPYLDKLIEKYGKNNIEFISLSCDALDKKNLWIKTVKDMKMKGLQLYMAGDMTLTDFFAVSSIPRYILIDPNGNIKDNRFTRPSNPKTITFLDMLAGN